MSSAPKLNEVMARAEAQYARSLSRIQNQTEAIGRLLRLRGVEDAGSAARELSYMADKLAIEQQRVLRVLALAKLFQGSGDPASVAYAELIEEALLVPEPPDTANSPDPEGSPGPTEKERA